MRPYVRPSLAVILQNTPTKSRNQPALHPTPWPTPTLCSPPVSSHGRPSPPDSILSPTPHLVPQTTSTTSSRWNGTGRPQTSPLSSSRPSGGQVSVPDFSTSTRSICRRCCLPSSSVSIPLRFPTSMHPQHWLSSLKLPAHPASHHGRRDPCIRWSSSSPLPVNCLLLPYPLPLSSCTHTGVCSPLIFQTVSMYTSSSRRCGRRWELGSYGCRDGGDCTCGVCAVSDHGGKPQGAGMHLPTIVLHSDVWRDANKMETRYCWIVFYRTTCSWISLL
jgi:hypothetical protein